MRKNDATRDFSTFTRRQRTSTMKNWRGAARQNSNRHSNNNRAICCSEHEPFGVIQTFGTYWAGRVSLPSTASNIFARRRSRRRRGTPGTACRPSPRPLFVYPARIFAAETLGSHSIRCVQVERGALTSVRSRDWSRFFTWSPRATPSKRRPICNRRSCSPIPRALPARFPRPLTLSDSLWGALTRCTTRCHTKCFRSTLKCERGASHSAYLALASPVSNGARPIEKEKLEPSPSRQCWKRINLLWRSENTTGVMYIQSSPYPPYWLYAYANYASAVWMFYLFFYFFLIFVGSSHFSSSTVF